ncbi:type I polyketide synthase [Fodinicurvata sediminis]|uniref:type I polyketide synthase n=1 Tax=Fodinicurvata sediminis TaxID=1121832 RepID=UPI0003B51391|nr:type I polyketide synthase [Fodinicurvata sediminis]
MKAINSQESSDSANSDTNEQFALTTIQAGIWLDWKKEQDPSSYNICNVIQFEGNLDVDRLWQAIVKADRENDALRLRFSNVDGDVRQHFASEVRATDFSVIDLRFADDVEAAAYQELEATRTRLLDPENGFLCRHRLFRLEDKVCWWVRVYHHLVCDGFAGHLLAERVQEIYRALGSNTAIPDCSFRSYRNFILSDAAYPESDAYTRDLAYWKYRLADGRPVTRFSARPDSAQSHHRQFPQSLSGDELDAIIGAAKKAGTSSPSLMMATFAVLLGQISGESHPILTVPMLNRIGRDERNTPGAFSCVVPLDIDLNKHQRISELAKDIFGRVRRDVRHIRLGPARMRAARLGGHSLLGGGAFFNSLDSMTPLEFDDTKAKRMNIYNAPVNDLGLVYFAQALSETENEAELIWQYNADRLEHETVVRIAECFRHILDAVIADPEQEIAALAALVGDAGEELRPGGGIVAGSGVQLQDPPVQATTPTSQERMAQDSTVGKLAERDFTQKVKAVWAELLQSDDIPVDANLFEIGAHSLLVPRAQFALTKLAGREIRSVEIFEHPSVKDFARYLLGQASPAIPLADLDTKQRAEGAETDTSDIAIVGMGIRLPGAEDRDALWSLLESGTDMIREIDAARLESLGGDPSQLEDPAFVARHGILDDVDSFDATLFSMTDREARETDPQHRLLLETALTAMEDSGCQPEQDGPVGVYVGVGFNSYMLDVLGRAEAGTGSGAVRYGFAIANDKDYAASRLAYKLNLTGPALSTSTACSTGLVNIALAVQALRAGQCRVALAGAASLGLAPSGGYYFTEGGIGSRSGICRPFDHRSDGVVGASGGAVVVLKKLSDAVADGDTIHGVIKGVGLSNDGTAKAAFSAPTANGQASAIRTALADGKVAPESIRFIEGHGTGTPLGDPIEVSALNQVFGSGDTSGKAPIWLGSVKGNFGHLDAAAGMVGLIKALLALKYRTLPPTCHFEEPNPRLPLEDGPFQINGQPVALAGDGATPLRAGVSSFGIGGTNAHVVLEAAPETTTRDERIADPIPHLLCFSAATPGALTSLMARTSVWLSHKGADADIRDLAYSLSRRRQYPYRAAIVAKTIQAAGWALADAKSPARVEGLADSSEAITAFLFPGQGAQQPGMARMLHSADAASAELIDQACETVAHFSGPEDLRSLLLATEPTSESAERLAQTDHAQPALFICEYAMARHLMACGVQPAALAGHSIGEYVAACLAGVMSFEDALRLMVIRGRLMASTNPGAMYALAAGEAEVGALLEAHGPELSLAAINSPRQCVVSGSIKAIDDFEKRLQQEGKVGRRLMVSRAFHSALMESVLADFRKAVGQIALSPPGIPIQSNLTGQWLRDAEAVNPDYWVQHMRNSVRFADNIKGLQAAMPGALMVDCGHGDIACRLAAANGADAKLCIATHPRQMSEQTGSEVDAGHVALQTALAQMWVQGVKLDFGTVVPSDMVRRIPVPTYAFDRRRHWARSSAEQSSRTGKERLHPASLRAEDTAGTLETGTPEIVNDGQTASAEQMHLFKVLRIWSEMFGNSGITADQDFTDLGGDSLLAVRIASRISEVFKVEVPASVMIEYQTPEAVAKFLSERTAHADGASTALTTNGSRGREHGAL